MLLPVEAFRLGFDHFLINAGDYVEKLRWLKSYGFGTETGEATDSDCIVIDIGQLSSLGWCCLPPGNQRDVCTSLAECLRKQPLRYIETMEIAVRDLWWLLQLIKAGHTSITAPANAIGDVDQPSSGGQDGGNALDERARRALEASAASLLTKGVWGSVHVALGGVLPPSDATVSIAIVDSIGMPVPLRTLGAKQIDTLVTVEGICTRATPLSTKASVIVARCRDCGHRKVLRLPAWRAGVLLPRVCEGGAGRGTTAGGTGENVGCSLDSYEIINEDCKFMNVQKVSFQESPHAVAPGDIPRHIGGSVAGALTDKLVPGAKARLVGVWTSTNERPGATNNSSSKAGSPYLHVLGVVPHDAVSREAASITGAGREALLALAQRPNIADEVAASIAPAVLGHCEVKVALACALFGGSRKRLGDGSTIRGDVHVLLLGDPGTAKSQLLKWISQVAPSAVYTSGKGSSAAGLTAAVMRDKDGGFVLEGGAMVLADGGVVCIDEFDKMREDDRVAIHEAMEQQTVSVAKAGLAAVLHTQCAVLAAANPMFGSYDDSKDASEQHAFETTILSRFDTIWLLRDHRDLEKDKAVAAHVLSLHGSQSHLDPPIAVDLLKRYLMFARSACHPTLTVEAAKRMENYYVDVREAARQRHTRNAIPITVRQLESIARIAEGFAKIRLSSSADDSDAQRAIELFKASTVAAATTLSSDSAETGGVALEAVDVARCEDAILQRLPIGGRCSKTTIQRDLRVRGFDTQLIAAALRALVMKNNLQERADGTIQRLNISSI